MAFILGIWMWNRYFTPELEYAPGTEQIALVKIDRDLRLADATAADPAWLRKLMGAGSREEVSADALKALAKLEAWQAMGKDSAFAHEIILSVHRGEMVPTDRDEGGGMMSWWRARIYETLESRGEMTGAWRVEYDRSLRALRNRAIWLSSAMALVVAAGAFFLPFTAKVLVRGLKTRTKGYAAAWSPALGLTVFMVATLAWIGYVGTLDLGLESIASFPPLMGLFLDTAARFLPVLIALGFLFKRPSHAIRVLGLDARPDLRLAFGMMPLLLILDLALRAAMENPNTTEPGGGLSLSDAGVSGLLFVIVSACLVAPFTEEILYRGVLFRSLSNRMGIIAAAVVSSLVFSAVHFYDLQGFVSVAIFGFVCALLYRATGSLTTVIALHVIYNLSIKIPAWVFYHMRLDG
ncbi:MAG TPA: type II CAAX endopeptidase family protein [Luteolibacter sp.]|nr:type II CAAX endopeptidase family protein [Luteolibacter sp.]